jgi:hypothetical protein
VATLTRKQDQETEDRAAKAREEIRALFERYRTTARRAEAEADEPSTAAVPDEDLVLTEH